MANQNKVLESNNDVAQYFQTSAEFPDLVIDGVYFGRGDVYINENTSTQFRHRTTDVKCWRIEDERLEEIDAELMNCFYSSESYIVQWSSITETQQFGEDNVRGQCENQVYFHWKGETASKGYSPLPDAIQVENPPVERIVQWAEPPAFLRIFSGKFVVHLGKYASSSSRPHLYILRGELDKELHLFEVALTKESLRSRTSFALYYPLEKVSIVWHGARSNLDCRKAIKKLTETVFGSDFTEVVEGAENAKFYESLPGERNFSTDDELPVMNYTPRLFYLNNITGSFLASEVVCSHKSEEITPFPFLQSHLYSAIQPATFLLDDTDNIWLWQGWHYCDQTPEFRSDCFVNTVKYAKHKSSIIEKLVKVHKVTAGFEPQSFIDLFPAWIKRDDIAKLQVKDGVSTNVNQLFEVIAHEAE